MAIRRISRTTSRKPQRPGETVYVALMRGINVGGKNKLPMKELATIFTDCGAHEVRTFIQSGNVLFAASASAALRIPTLVAKRITADYGFSVPVLLRSADELQRVAKANPFLRVGRAASHGLTKNSTEDALHVLFLADKPDRRLVAELDVNRSPGDSFKVQGREVFLHLPTGVARTKLTNAYFDSKLRTISTMRNWRTVLTLVDLSREGA